MEFSGISGIALFFGFLVVADVVMHYAGEGIGVLTGSILLKIASRGLIKCGETRELFGPHPKPQSSRVFYVENAQHFMYRNFVVVIGILFWVIVGGIFGYVSSAHAL